MLLLRLLSNIIFYISSLLYGILLVQEYNKYNIKVYMGFLIIILYLIMLFCVMIAMDTLYKDSDPINKYNLNRNIAIFILQSVHIPMWYFCAITNTIKAINICICVWSITLIATCIFNYYCFKLYYSLCNHEEITNIIEEFSNEKKILFAEYSNYKKTFVILSIYVCFLIFIYNITLMNWINTFLFIIFNGIFLFYNFKRVFKRLIAHCNLYMIIVLSTSSIGIFLSKASYSQLINISFMQGRDNIEHLMVMILFYLPILYSGFKLNGLYKKSIVKWVK